MLKRVFIVIIILIFFVSIFSGVIYFTTPNSIKNPKYEHAHFRIDFVNNNQSENFADKKYQEGYSKDQCGAEISKEPFHFHDDKNNIVHLHWQSLTGGQFLKYYGLNRVDWINDYLGIREDRLKENKLELVKIHGNILPKINDKINYYVYTGNAQKYEKRNIEDFVNQDFETFFNKKSSIKEILEKEEESKSKLNFWEVKVKAHTEKVENYTNTPTSKESPKTEDELKQINNLLGDVIIFVQKDEPSDSIIKEHFSKLEPLTLSTCGG
jgi:hypothetical protein